MEIIKNIADKVFLSQQKSKLEKELERLEGQIKITKKFPEYGTSEDENAQEVEKFQENLGLQKNLQNLIKQTKEALKRIEKGKYGICTDCEDPIEQGRLKIYPSASLCASCASKKYRK